LFVGVSGGWIRPLYHFVDTRQHDCLICGCSRLHEDGGSMAQQKKRIRHDEIVARFGQRLRELRLSRGMSQAEIARHAEVTTNYISRLEGGGAAPGIDLAARLALALGVSLADLLPTTPVLDDMAVTRRQAKKLFDELLQREDRAVLVLLTQLLARLAEATNR
jgi:transcriptional regulator with XRE-family HTH domain